MRVAVVGGGLCGLALGLNLHRRGISCKIYERVPQPSELGVGITLLPHAMREFSALGFQDELLRLGIENKESAFYNRFGQLIYKEPRGRGAGYDVPEVGVHRGRLYMMLYRAALERLGPEAIYTNHTCQSVQQDDRSATVYFTETSSGRTLQPATADVVIACDGIHSAIRKQFYPDDDVVFAGIVTWRGTTRRKPILDGRTYLRIGSVRTAKLLVYPIIDDVDGHGNQLINWLAAVEKSSFGESHWSKEGDLADFAHLYADWKFSWLDVPSLLGEADRILEYPMVDKEPLDRWTFGRVTLAGDAAHPMCPRGSNGAAQAAIDARTLADVLEGSANPAEALLAYEGLRREHTAKIVLANRSHPPDIVNIKVEELVGDRPFENLDDYITQEELRRYCEEYERVAGFSRAQVNRR